MNYAKPRIIEAYRGNAGKVMQTKSHFDHKFISFDETAHLQFYLQAFTIRFQKGFLSWS